MSVSAIPPASATQPASVRASLPIVGYLGVGLMGRPMTERLLAAGCTVHVWNRTAAKLAPLVERGAIACASPAEVVARADIVLMCLMDSASVEQVVFGAQGVAATPARGKLLVDHASIRPDATRAFAARLAAANGMRWIDAPVSGGVAGAAAGTLAIMCGGATADIERARPVLARYAGNITRMGEVGAGQVAKLCNQIIVGSTIATIAEAVRLAQAGGVDAALLPQALAGGWADSKPLAVFVPRMVTPPETPIGAASTMLKDLDTALDLARATATPLPMASEAAELFRALAARGWGESDPAQLVRLYA